MEGEGRQDACEAFKNENKRTVWSSIIDIFLSKEPSKGGGMGAAEPEFTLVWPQVQRTEHTMMV